MTGFSFDAVFPDRWLHADDLAGKQVTLTITDAYLEELRSPTGERSECPILKFGEPKKKREYILNKSNGLVCKALWGNESADWIGHRITLAPEPEERSPSGYKIVFMGSPELTEPKTVDIGAGKKRTLRATGTDSASKSTRGASTLQEEAF